LHLLKLEDDEDINKEEEEEKSKLADICDVMILSIFRDDKRCRRRVLEVSFVEYFVRHTEIS
jgi:hypothetical protein